MEIATIYLSIATIVIGAVGLCFIGMQYFLNKKKRRDDLFNLRYDFFLDLTRFWLRSHDLGSMEYYDLLPFIMKADFIFGEDIKNHILSLEGKQSLSLRMPEEDFIKPFGKYLKLY